jgi:exosortase A-associated hydrolase 1
VSKATAEEAVTFVSGEHPLVGILHEPPHAASVGIMILVGGPQYRVGSHRMFVQIGRELAARGRAVFRFDFAGMGDSGGSFRGFERLDGDVAAALDCFRRVCPRVNRFVLLGLCDGATAAAYYAHTDSRIVGLVLLNPWVHTQRGEAKVFVREYYAARLLQAEFWRGLLRGEVLIGASIRDLLWKLRRAYATDRGDSPGDADFVDRMREALMRFSGRVLVAVSGNDYTASEFVTLWSTDPRWRTIRESAEVVSLPAADHTLSSREQLLELCDAVSQWCRLQWPAASAAIGSS